MNEIISDGDYKLALNRAAIERSGVHTNHGSQAIGSSIDCVAFANAMELFVGKGWGEIMPTTSSCFHPERGGSCALLTEDGRLRVGVSCPLQTPWKDQGAEALKAKIFASLQE